MCVSPNQPVSSVTDMRYMFNGASSFNQELRDWDVSKVTDMEGMFHSAYAFDRDISNWKGKSRQIVR